MIGLFYFVLAILASPFKSKLQLQAESLSGIMICFDKAFSA